MTTAQEAYIEAQRRIEQAYKRDGNTLDLSIEGLEDIPPEIDALTSLTELDLENTKITSAEPLTGLTSLTRLSLFDTQITSAEPLAALTNLTQLDLSGTEINDLRPVMNLDSLINDGFLDGLFFLNCAATRLDPELKRLSKVGGIGRTRDTLAYLKSLTD